MNITFIKRNYPWICGRNIPETVFYLSPIPHRHFPLRPGEKTYAAPGICIKRAHVKIIFPYQLPFSGIIPPPVTREAVEHYCANEWAMHLDDVMVRRTSWSHYNKDVPAIAAQTAAWMKEILGWDDATELAELERFRQATK